MGGPAGKGAVSKEKKTTKENAREKAEEVNKKAGEKAEEMKKNARTLAEAEEALARIRRKQLEAGEEEEKIDLSDFDELLRRFLSGDLDVSALSVKIYDKLQKSAAVRKSFLETPQGQMMADKALDAIQKKPGAMNDPNAMPLINFLGAVAAGKKTKKAADNDDWEIIDKPTEKRHSAPQTITVEEGKKEQEEAMEALRKLHKEMGLKSPEEMKKEIQANAKGMV